MQIDLTVNKRQEIATNAVSSEKYNFIMYGGAIRGGKTFWGLSVLLILCVIYKGSRWCVIRQNTEKLRTTTIPSFNKIEPSGVLKSSPYEYTHPNGSVILFKGENYDRDKDLDWMKGLEVNGFLFEEINECQEQTLNKAFERAGSWILPKKQPKPIVLATCNPSFGWVKSLVYDRYKNSTLPPKWLYIPAKITDNPFLPQSYLESLQNLPKFEYEVFVNGNWDIQLKTGNEFFKEFELEKHVRFVNLEIDNTIHISIDSNVFPYIAVTVWQLSKDGEQWTIKQVHELPIKDPNNTARKAGLQVAKWLKSIGYKMSVYLYGDPTTTARNNINDDKKSFLDLFKEPINKEFRIEQRFFRKAPPVAATGDFINAIFEAKIQDVEIVINEACKVSINDYIETKQDKDGTMLKKRITDPQTKISYEPNGHLLDSCRYFIIKAFETEFNKFQRRFSDYSDGSLPTNESYFNTF